MTQASASKRWHVAQWPVLGWTETIIKAIGIVIGVAAGVKALSVGEFAMPNGAQLLQLLVLAVLSLGLLAAIGDRWLEREVVAMAFVIFNNLGHWGMVAALLAVAGAGDALIWFSLLFMIGDLVKVRFLITTDFRVRGLSRATMLGLTLFYVAGYALLLILAVLGR